MSSSLIYKAQTRQIFRAHVKLKISAFWDEVVFDELFDILNVVDRSYNSHVAGSYIDNINKNAGQFTAVDDQTVQILSRLKTLADDLDGQYDITVMPLVRLWGFYKDNDFKVPSAEEIAKIKKQVDYSSIDVCGHSVRVGEKQEIGTGPFLKAYAIDQLAAHMREIGISDAVVNGGGSTILAINNESHPEWKIQVNDANNPGRELFQLKISNACYSTSSNENTYIEIDGRRYGHIISPKTGYPSENRQVGLVSPAAFEGDVFSTALFNFPKEDFLVKMDFLSQKYGVEGFLVDKDGQTVFSRNFEKYIS